jgi:uncharacterized protein (TIGR02453 family)
MESGFSGFTAESFEFLRDLSENNNKPWFDRNRPRYEEHITGTFRRVLATLEPFLLKLDAQFETLGKTNRNFSRINRDIRFSKDKRPYKSNYYLYVFDRSRDRGDVGRLYVVLSGECVTVGFSIYSAGSREQKGALESIFRKRFSSNQDLFYRLLEQIVRKGRYEAYWHRQEKGEWVLHPGLPKRQEDWLTLHAWIVRKVFPAGAKGLSSAAFAGRVRNIFSELYPLYVFTTSASPRWRSQLRKRA